MGGKNALCWVGMEWIFIVEGDGWLVGMQWRCDAGSLWDGSG